MIRSTKVISEDIDAAQLALNKYEMEARGIIGECRNAADENEVPAEDRRRFDVLCGPGDSTDGLIQRTQHKLKQLQNELQHAQDKEGRIKMYQQHPSSIVYNQMNSGGELENLLVGGTVGQRDYSAPVPCGRLRAFADAQTALDSGRWLQAMHTRWQGGINERAEQHCKSVGLDITNTMSEGTGATGGYAVPAPVSATIISVRERVGVARKACMVMPMTADTLTIPRRTGGLTVYAPGEANAITASDASLGQVELIAKKRAVYGELSQELSDDAIINMADFLFEEMGYGLALQEDNELINGTGAATTYFGVRGLLNKLGAGGVSQAAAGHDTWPELDMADVMAAVGKLPDRFFEYGASWICSYAFFNSVFARLAFAAGGATASEVMGGTGNVRSFAGYPVYLTSQMPVTTATATVCALFGAFDRAAVLGNCGTIRLARSDDFKFSSDLVCLRATSRYDINVYDFGTASVAGAYVGLKTAS